ncbi:MAG: light-harvesting antenna LH1, beta subunit [Thiohalocapsa sp.]
MAEENKASSLSGLTEAEAKEFHRFFVTGFLVFTAVAIGAHFLVWSWRPWLPGVDGYGLLELGQTAVNTLMG